MNSKQWQNGQGKEKWNINVSTFFAKMHTYLILIRSHKFPSKNNTFLEWNFSVKYLYIQIVVTIMSILSTDYNNPNTLYRLTRSAIPRKPGSNKFEDVYHDHFYTKAESDNECR